MNYRAEIDALPPRVTLADYANLYDPSQMRQLDGERADAAEARLALAARIHAEPHAWNCDFWTVVIMEAPTGHPDNPVTGEVPHRFSCTCGKDAAMAEVLG